MQLGLFNFFATHLCHKHYYVIVKGTECDSHSLSLNMVKKPDLKFLREVALAVGFNDQ